MGHVLRRLRMLVLSTHPGPSLTVTAIGIALAIGIGLEPYRTVLVAIAIAANQISIGLANDWLDARRDRQVGRRDKPVARGEIPPSMVRDVAIVSAGVAIAATIPLGWAAAAQLVLLASGHAYNFGLKRTPFSALPYAVGFAALPAIVTLAGAEPRLPTWWAAAAGALLGIAAHFANVLPDLHDDARTGVRGLPHRLGARTSAIAIWLALAAAGTLILLGGDTTSAGAAAIGILTAAVVVTGLWLSFVRPPSRTLFRLIMLAALLDVGLLVAGGSRILV